MAEEVANEGVKNIFWVLAIAFFCKSLNHEMKIYIYIYLNISLLPHRKHCILITNKATNQT